ncbi:transcriptional regulator LysR family [Vibrio variabilis]|uniref:Transcriptional regulator LysR family n=1 Tax=Vibrio variabilis TaxID=990271 RepID=A0ABQ0JBS4_9VIBR|nr:transcriptional regulator LysR family [Vibrio variabilis]
MDGAEEWSRPLYISYRKNSTSLEAILQVESLINTVEPTTSFVVQQAGESGE